jgi:hypothetical protein
LGKAAKISRDVTMASLPNQMFDHNKTIVENDWLPQGFAEFFDHNKKSE